MMLRLCSVLALWVVSAHAFGTLTAPPTRSRVHSSTALSMEGGRRDFVRAAAAAAAFLGATPAQAKIFLDPAMYGDQELRQSAVDSLRERVRRAILQNPALATSFYQLALLDGLSYNQDTKEGGPDGSVLKSVLSSSKTDEYTKNLQAAAECLLDSTVALKKMTSITVADAVALGGSEAVRSVGGPVLTVQLGRTDTTKSAKAPSLNYELLSGNVSPKEVQTAFLKAGMTEREMTVLLGALLTVDSVQKSRSTEDWKESVKPKFRERGKMGRMSDFKQLTDEDIARMEDEYNEDPDEGWYIADSFGSRDEAFGARIGKDQINEQTFNQFLRELNGGSQKKGAKVDVSKFGWIATVLLDPNSPTTQSWLNKYSSSNLSFLKDLGVAFNAVTQLGAEYTGGKYESLLKDKKRKSLNDDELKLF